MKQTKWWGLHIHEAALRSVRLFGTCSYIEELSSASEANHCHL